jgi:hypothetical protein
MVALTECCKCESRYTAERLWAFRFGFSNSQIDGPGAATAAPGAETAAPEAETAAPGVATSTRLA